MQEGFQLKIKDAVIIRFTLNPNQLTVDYGVKQTVLFATTVLQQSLSIHQHTVC